jgi:hypothetical protein
MIAEYETPTERGIPYPLLPPPYSLPSDRHEIADDNHAFHPRLSPLLEGVSGEAIRNCRVQRTDWYDHHIVYHGYYEGPKIPTDEAERFRIVVLAAAGYIPDLALDCHGYRPEIVPITPEVRDRLWRSREIRVYRSGPVRKFLAEYVTGQDLSHVHEEHIDEFLHTDKEDRKLFLGHWLLSQATEVAAESLGQDYRDAQRLGKIIPGLTRKPQNFVQSNFGNRFERNPVVKLLQERLQAA